MRIAYLLYSTLICFEKLRASFARPPALCYTSSHDSYPKHPLGRVCVDGWQPRIHCSTFTIGFFRSQTSLLDLNDNRSYPDTLFRGLFQS